jgi:asparagine synthase (glutamine-hydrolysing)
MCGIAGLISANERPVDRDRLLCMVDKIAHRGPDGEGILVDGSVGLGHRRLAIVDLSDTGKQPMVSSDGRLVIVFNGEIYNFRELRKELTASGVAFRSSSDTEVMLALFEREGESMLKKLRGMFAFAIWDKEKNELFFARDRIGKKPFFWTNDDRGFAFASEVGALVASGKPEVDWDAVRLFLGLQYIPSPRTGFKNVHALPPSHCGFVRDGNVEVKRYVSFAAEPKIKTSFEDAAKRVRVLLDESVRLRMIADVPVGTFLSGGIDSSAVACLMAKRSALPIKTFTMGFPSLGYDERAEARSLAATLGAEHHEFEASPAEALRVIDDVLDAYQAPFADASAIPTYLLARETRRHVKAVMTGDGGDELFGGYRRYRYFQKAMRWKDIGFGVPAGFITRMLHSALNDPRFARFDEMVSASTVGEAYGELFTGSYFGSRDIKNLLQADFLSKTTSADAASFVAQNIRTKGVEAAMEFDLHSYLPDDLNVKMDRATMAHGLEGRSPLLDQELVSYVTRLPVEYRLSPRGQKALLAEAVRDIVPSEVFSRPKRGFQVPLAEWLRGPLRSTFVERCLSSDVRLLEICRKEEITRYLHENDRGTDHGNRLWMLLALSTWLERYG